MIKSTIFIISFLSLISLNCFSQNKSHIKELGIQSKKIYYIDYEDSNGTELLESEEKYNGNGLLVEKINYLENGKIKNHSKYEYNNQGRLIKETRFFPNGNKKKTIEYKFDNNGLKTEKIIFDSKDIVISKKRYEYSYR